MLTLIDNEQKMDKSKKLGNFLPILPIVLTVDVVTNSSIPMGNIGVMEEVVENNNVPIPPAIEKVASGAKNIKVSKKPQQPCYGCRNVWWNQYEPEYPD